MSKVATYLQGHIAGELLTRRDVRESVARDGSVLERAPDMVVYPRTTNDIRKVLRFSWQLAEKGHPLPVTARGAGTDTTGAAIGRGISMVLAHHMNQVFEYDAKQKLVRLQPGASVESVRNALRLHGSAIPPLDGGLGTLGGEVATDGPSRSEYKHGRIGDWVDKLEVVLDNGETLQTGKINKRELNRRKGLQTREGDIYRGIDGVLEDHAELIGRMKSGEIAVQGGYPGIAYVRDKDGSLDLTPLIVGSQGTLGIISEMIMRTTFVPAKLAMAVMAFDRSEKARDAVDILAKLVPASVEYYDGRLLAAAREQGSIYEWLGDKPAVGAVLVVTFDDFNERRRTSQLKKAVKLVQKLDADAVIATTDKTPLETLAAVRGVVDMAALPTLHADRGGPLLVDGFHVPPGRFEDFLGGLAELEQKLHAELPLYGSPLSGVFAVRPTLSLQKVGDKQKVFKIIDQLGALLAQYDGRLVTGSAEGRLLSRFVRASWTDEYTAMVDEIRRVFDPYGILNPEVKAGLELRDLVAQLRSDNAIGL